MDFKGLIEDMVVVHGAVTTALKTHFRIGSRVDVVDIINLGSKLLFALF